MRASEPGRFDDVALTPPSVLFEQQLVIDGGDLTLELFATPGHKPDHIAVFIPEIRTLLPGDAAELPFPFVESAATLPAMRDSLARMAALNAETALYCHAPVTSGPALLQQNMAYFDTIEQRCRAALARGSPARPLPTADVEALVGFPFTEALPADADAAALEGFYRPGHQAAIRAMLDIGGWGIGVEGMGRCHVEPERKRRTRDALVAVFGLQEKHSEKMKYLLRSPPLGRS